MTCGKMPVKAIGEGNQLQEQCRGILTPHGQQVPPLPRDVLEEREGEAGGAGVWDAKVCAPKMAQENFPYCKFRFFPQWSPWWGWGGGSGEGPSYGRQLFHYILAPPIDRGSTVRKEKRKKRGKPSVMLMITFQPPSVAHELSSVTPPNRRRIPREPSIIPAPAPGGKQEIRTTLARGKGLLLSRHAADGSLRIHKGWWRCLWGCRGSNEG